MKEKGIVAQAYSPLGSGKTDLFTNDVVKSIAEKHGLGEKTAPILLGYPCSFVSILFFAILKTADTGPQHKTVKKGQVVIAKSTTESRIRENASVAQLDDEDIAKLNALAASGKQKRIGTPPWGEFTGSCAHLTPSYDQI
jgi:glycerol 2-dehydrogenase (NADP+)